MERRFDLPWDTGLRITTALFLLILLGAGVGVPLATWRGAAGGPAAVAGLALPLLAVAVVLPLSWALAPRALVLGSGALRVDRPLRPVEVPLAGVRAAGRLPPGALRGLVRVWGSGGAFGYYGRFWSRRLGAVRMYATRRDGGVVIDTDEGRLLVTPGEPDAFVAALLQAAPRARALPAGELAPAPGGSLRSRRLLAAGLAAALLLGGVVLALWTRGRGGAGP